MRVECILHCSPLVAFLSSCIEFLIEDHGSVGIADDTSSSMSVDEDEESGSLMGVDGLQPSLGIVAVGIDLECALVEVTLGVVLGRFIVSDRISCADHFAAVEVEVLSCAIASEERIAELEWSVKLIEQMDRRAEEFFQKLRRGRISVDFADSVISALSFLRPFWGEWTVF